MQRVRKGRVLVLLASGFEEADVSIIIRTLRSSGLPVTVVGMTVGSIRGAYGLLLTPDAILSDVEKEPFDAIVVPGGMQGARQLNADPRVHTLLRRTIAQGGCILALDAAYMVLRSAGVLQAVEDGQVEERAPRWRERGLLSERVMTEGSVIFGQDSGAAQEATMALVAQLEQSRWMRRER